MQITRNEQYNQGFGRSKIMSSAAGVGSIVITKFGTSCLILCIEEWEVIKQVLKSLHQVETDPAVNKTQVYESLKNRLGEKKINLIDDHRFIEFLKVEQQLPNLIALVNVPQISLNERNNFIQPEDPSDRNWKNDLLLKYFIPSIHFPTYFIGRKKKELRPIKWWRDKWGRTNTFAPPRDFSMGVGDKNDYKQAGNYKQLIQSNLVLICRKGHLSDIPWSKFLNWKSQHGRNDRDKGAELYSMEDCCNDPDLKWSENRATSEGFSNIYLECLKCKKKENLEGINSLKPKCPGHKPWETDLNSQDWLPRSSYCGTQEVRIDLISSNSIYYSNTFTNIFFPTELVKGYSKEVEVCLNNQEKKFKRLHEKQKWTREEYAEDRINYDELCVDYEREIDDDPSFIAKVKKAFLRGDSIGVTLDPSKVYEDFRFQEYKVLIQNQEYFGHKLSFNQINIPSKLTAFFDVISRIDLLSESQIQLGFSRVAPLNIEQRAEQMTIYRSQKQNVRTLPSIQSMGEGIFFSLNKDKLNGWLENIQELEQRLRKLLSTENQANISTKDKLEEYGLQFLLIHSLSHLIMRGLEFSCGYPTSSLKERLYVSDRMSGFMIYTSEGAEGSMGGLVSQTEDNNLVDLFDVSFQQAYDCSSDPLCWESTSQGVNGLNLAACFSCSLTSETSCEEFNLGLDRRVVIDPELGFFKGYEF